MPGAVTVGCPLPTSTSVDQAALDIPSLFAAMGTEAQVSGSAPHLGSRSRYR